MLFDTPIYMNGKISTHILYIKSGWCCNVDERGFDGVSTNDVTTYNDRMNVESCFDGQKITSL